MIGLPIMMVFLANIGGSMANALKYTYSRICCRWCRARRKMEENTETDVVSLKTDKVGQETYMPTDLVRDYYEFMGFEPFSRRRQPATSAASIWNSSLFLKIGRGADHCEFVCYDGVHCFGCHSLYAIGKLVFGRFYLFLFHYFDHYWIGRFGTWTKVRFFIVVPKQKTFIIWQH